MRNQCVNRAMYVTPETFEKHIRWMKSTGEIVDQGRIFEKGRGTRFVVTFDDGWKDNYIHAFPILKKYEVPAIIFICTESINEQKLFWPEEVGMAIMRSSKTEGEIASVLQQLTRSAMKLVDHNDRVSIDSNWNSTSLLDRFVEYLKVLSVEKRDDFVNLLHLALGVSQNGAAEMLLSWDEIDDMRGHKISFGSHTHTHPILDRMDETNIDIELRTSKKILEQRLNEEVLSFSYPNGCFGKYYIQSSLRGHGYKYAFTLERSPVRLDTDRFLIPRCLVYEDIAANLETYYWKLVMNSFATEGVSRVKKLFLRKDI